MARFKLPENYQDIIDESGDIDKRLEWFEKVQKRKKELRAEFAKWAEQLKPEASKTIDGNRYAVAIGPKRTERRVKSMAAAFKRLGEKLFISLCTLPLKALKENLPPEEMEALTVQERTGHREITVMPRVAQAERKKAA